MRAGYSASSCSRPRQINSEVNHKVLRHSPQHDKVENIKLCHPEPRSAATPAKDLVFAFAVVLLFAHICKIKSTARYFGMRLSMTSKRQNQHQPQGTSTFASA
jgi:hypothetical protein